MIISHEHELYHAENINNGAYHYSCEIVENFIPNITTTRNWVTIKVDELCLDHSIYFVHNNIHTEIYNFLRKYKDLVLVCGIPETVEKVKHLGRAIYLPLSVDVKYVEPFRCEKTKQKAFVGRQQKRLAYSFPSNVDLIENLDRDELLTEMAKYRQVYAVGRTAIEAKILDCEVLPYDIRFKDPKRWVVKDNSEAVLILQKLLDEIDGGTI